MRASLRSWRPKYPANWPRRRLCPSKPKLRQFNPEAKDEHMSLRFYSSSRVTAVVTPFIKTYTHFLFILLGRQWLHHQLNNKHEAWWWVSKYASLPTSPYGGVGLFHSFSSQRT